MFLKATCRTGSASFYCQNVAVRLFATQVEAAKNDRIIKDDKQNDYQTAEPFSSIPGPSSISFVLSYLPGGKFHNIDLREVMKDYREQYGDLIKIPGVFGNRDVLISHDPEHFQIVFRTEGPWPNRSPLAIMQHFIEKVRPEFFGEHHGLLNSQGKTWSDFRSTVNFAVIQPKAVKTCIPKIDEITSEFTARMKSFRHPVSNQLPETFNEELKKWALECLAMFVINTRLHLISGQYEERSIRLFGLLRSFAMLLYEMEMKPPIWKLIAGSEYRKFLCILNAIVDLVEEYIEEARMELESCQISNDNTGERGQLETLLMTNPKILKVLALDLLFAGIETTSSACTSVLYQLAKNPDKQETLRAEVRGMLPEKTSACSIEKMNHLPYLRACIKEALRIMPTLNGNVRGCGQDIVLNGYKVPKGTQIVMNSPLLQKDDDNFPHALKFLPERWLKSLEKEDDDGISAKTAHPFIYLPFGFGPRMCIGKRLAELEIEVLLLKIIRNFYISWEHPDLRFKWTTLNIPDAKLMFTLTDVEN